MGEVIQLSVVIGSEAGRVSEVTRLLGEDQIDIRGFSVSESADHGVLRLIVDRPTEALSVLRDGGFTVRDSGVICVELPHHPGGLASILAIVSEAGVNIEYVYSLIGTCVVLDVAHTARALALLKGAPIRIVEQAEISAH